ncbi:MAG: transglutaminase domain-containing protein [Oscillospiraceae bacterium]|nr:transglutaminase domain-containing protein [Oscillospiraceae bacterium]
MKKLLSIILSAVISFTVFSGCKHGTTSEKSEDTSEETTVTVSVAEKGTTTVNTVSKTETVTTIVTTTEATTVTPKITVASETTAESEITATPQTITESQTTVTTKVTAATEPAAKPVATIKELNNRTILVYDGIQNFKQTNNLVLYDFSDIKDVGISRDGTIHPMRMHYGMTAEVKNGYVYFSSYNDYPYICKVSVKSIDIISDTSVKSIKVSDKTQKLDMSSYANGLYAISTTWSNNQTSIVFMYANDGSVKLCSVETMSNSELEDFKARRDRIDYLLELQNITPENAIDTSDLCYPWLNQIETDLWMDLSDDIIKENWSESRKLFAFHEWMCENLAYDNYKADKGIRSFAQNDSSGKYDTWQSRIGVCHDWVNILLTMCRAQGIPCITADDTDHTWNLVYINGSWIEIDMTIDIRNNVYGEDMTNWICDGESIYCYNAYGDEFVKKGIRKSPEELIVLNGSLWTFDILCGIIPYGAYDLLAYYENNKS